MHNKEKEPVSISRIQMQHLDFTLFTGLESTILCFEPLVFLFGLTDEMLLDFF